MIPAVSEPLFPVTSLREAAPYLRRPFAPAAIKFKVQAQTGPPAAPTGGLIVAYIDARLVIERFNLLLPDQWWATYEAISANAMWCHLTVDGVTRTDVGEGKSKGLVSDALKRAAVHFGVGVSVYAYPHALVNVDTEFAKLRGSGSKKRVELTEAGIAAMRDRYKTWLDASGEASFGEPLDHGDVTDVQAEAAAQDDDQPNPDQGTLPLDDDRAVELRDAIEATYKLLREADKTTMLPAQFHAELSRSSGSHAELSALLGVLEQKLKDAQEKTK